MACVWNHQKVGAGDLSGEFAGARGRRAQIVGAAEDQRGDSRERSLVGGRGGFGQRPAGTGDQIAEVDRVAHAEGSEGRWRQGACCCEAFLQALGRAGASLPGELLLLAAGREVQRTVEVFASFAASGEQQQTGHRCVISSGRRAQSGHEVGPEAIGEVSREQEIEHLLRPEDTVLLVPLAVECSQPQRMVAHTGEQVGEIGDGVGGDAPAGATAAQLAKDAGHGGEGRTAQGVGPVGRDDGVQHQRFDMRGVGLGV